MLAASQSKRLVSANGAFVSRALFPFDVARQSEFYELRLSPLGEDQSEGHGPGVQENLVVAQGVLEISVNDERYLLSTGACSIPTSLTVIATLQPASSCKTERNNRSK